MKIKKKLSQNRRDFRAIYVCEHSNCEHESSGYDDNYFHQTVIPDMTCKSCGKKAPKEFVPETPKYPSHLTL